MVATVCVCIHDCYLKQEEEEDGRSGEAKTVEEIELISPLHSDPSPLEPTTPGCVFLHECSYL